MHLAVPARVPARRRGEASLNSLGDTVGVTAGLHGYKGRLHPVADVQQHAVLRVHAVLSLIKHDRVVRLHHLVVALDAALRRQAMHEDRVLLHVLPHQGAVHLHAHTAAVSPKRLGDAIAGAWAVALSPQASAQRTSATAAAQRAAGADCGTEPRASLRPWPAV